MYTNQKQWQQLLNNKKLFLAREYDKIDKLAIRQEILDSWYRSLENGVDPHKNSLGKRLKGEKLQEVMQKSARLLKIAEPLIDAFTRNGPATSGSLIVCDPDGVIILRKFFENEFNRDPIKMAVTGDLWTEENIGTTAHSLSLYLDKPMQVIGPENYNHRLEESIASAVPIHNSDGACLGAIVLAQTLPEQPWDQNFQIICTHTLSLIIALAIAIEAQINLRDTNRMLTKANENLEKVNIAFKNASETLETTLAFSDEGLITIDAEGRILHANKEGARILAIKGDAMGKVKITDYFDQDSIVVEKIRQGQTGDYIEDALHVNGKEHLYLFSFKPIFDGVGGHTIGAVLRLNSINKINELAATRMGISVRFTFDKIIGKSEPFVKAKMLTERFAKADENILLIGESGTGKELFAQAIHNRYRPKGPFVAINCAAMPRDLIESELFGYESGSFTGAEKSGRPGKIEMAHGGVLFLDEIGDMPIELQAVLLRVLQDKHVMRIGGSRYRQVNFRLITATNKNLYRMIQENTFREDLYFRLSVLKVTIPPLRDRKEDISLLADYFMREYCNKITLPIPQISMATRIKLMEYEWPGNVRQLENAIIYAVNVATEGIIGLEHLPEDLSGEDNHYRYEKLQQTYHHKEKGNDSEILSMDETEQLTIENALQKANGNVTETAKLLGMSKSTLYRRMKKYNLGQFEDSES